MPIRRETPTAAAVAALALIAQGAPAQEASATTRAVAARAPATVAMALGSLSITTPAAMDVGQAVPGASLDVRFSAVEVNDTRTLASAGWTVDVTANHFNDPSGLSKRINRSQVSYWSGPATFATGIGTFVPGQVTRAQRVNLSTTRTAFRLTGGRGNNTARWQPTLVIRIPAEALDGRYTGTISHSVS
jgi:hypothetical protein